MRCRLGRFTVLCGETVSVLLLTFVNWGLCGFFSTNVLFVFLLEQVHGDSNYDSCV